MKNYRTTFLLSLCHMGIDFLCAFSLYRLFVERYEAFMLYSFCAFALQMPMGVLIDKWSLESGKALRPGLFFVWAGIIVTIFGSFVSNIILGIGNALFHVGGGVLAIREDDDNGLKGRALGCFVAPGAIGLILGVLYYDTQLFSVVRIIVSVLMCIVATALCIGSRERELQIRYRRFSAGRKELPWIIILCFLVVVIRSLTGMAIAFPWRQGSLITIISTVFLASGKTAGGFIGAKLGMRRTIVITLLVSAAAYLFGDSMIAGLLALFFFNMTMPLTLYLLARNMSDMPGLAFGILTFALFLGYLPVHWGYFWKEAPSPFGVIASLISLVLLYLAERMSAKGDEDE